MGCPEPALPGRSRCAVHYAAVTPTRATATERGYGQPWVRARAAHLKHEPNCRNCGATSDPRPNQVHHIIPISRGGTHREENLVTLCEHCHGRLEYYLHKLERERSKPADWKRGRVMGARHG